MVARRGASRRIRIQSHRVEPNRTEPNRVAVCVICRWHSVATAIAVVVGMHNEKSVERNDGDGGTWLDAVGRGRGGRERETETEPCAFIPVASMKTRQTATARLLPILTVAVV